MIKKITYNGKEIPINDVVIVWENRYGTEIKSNITDFAKLSIKDEELARLDDSWDQIKKIWNIQQRVMV